MRLVTGDPEMNWYALVPWERAVSAAAVAQMTEEMEARLSATWRAEALALRSELAAKAPANELATLELQQVPLSLSVCCFRQ